MNTLALRRGMVLVISGSVLMALAARVTVPMWPVPMTMQTAALLFLAGVLGGWWAGLALLVYVIEGAFGLPVFAGGAAGLVGPSAGYLLGYPLAAMVAGYALERGVWTLLAFLLAEAIFYTTGLLWLRAWMPDWSATIAAGLTPFLFGDALKMVIAWVLVRGVRYGGS